MSAERRAAAISGMRLSGHSKIALTQRIQRRNVPVAKKP